MQNLDQYLALREKAWISFNYEQEEHTTNLFFDKKETHSFGQKQVS